MRRSRRWHQLRRRVAAPALVLAALLLAVASTGSALRDRALLASVRPTSVPVTSVEEVVDRGGTGYQLEVDLPGPGGTTVLPERSYDAPQVGDRVDVVIDPSDPAHVLLPDARPVEDLLLGSILGALGVAGALALLLRTPGYPRAAQLRAQRRAEGGPGTAVHRAVVVSTADVSRRWLRWTGRRDRRLLDLLLDLGDRRVQMTLASPHDLAPGDDLVLVGRAEPGGHVAGVTGTGGVLWPSGPLRPPAEPVPALRCGCPQGCHPASDGTHCGCPRHQR